MVKENSTFLVTVKVNYHYFARIPSIHLDFRENGRGPRAGLRLSVPVRSLWLGSYEQIHSQKGFSSKKNFKKIKYWLITKKRRKSFKKRSISQKNSKKRQKNTKSISKHICGTFLFENPGYSNPFFLNRTAWIDRNSQ